MSKTKEQILKPYVVLGDDSPDFAYPSDVYEAMDEYAQQAVQEYKEKLKTKVSDQKYMLIVTKETFIDLINEV